MDKLSSQLDALGDAVAEVSERTADRSTLPKARRRLLAPAKPRPARRRLRVAMAMAAAVALGCVLAVVLLMDRTPVASFEVGSPPVAGSVGDWVAAEQQPLPMRFSDGSAFELEPGARLRVTETRTDGASLVIERGVVRARVVHDGPHTRWLLAAGPFSVRVIGTSFDVSWTPQSETFQVVLKHGVVVVNGPLLPQDRRVVAGERLVVSVRDGRMDLSAAQALAAASSTAAAVALPTTEPAPVPCASPEPEPSASAAGATASAAASAAPLSWRKLASERKYNEAMAELERLGFETEIERASSSGLMALADVARFSGQPARAKQALLAQRRRFGARGYSAFLLGRIAADQLGAPAEAVRWFETYLGEEPGGPLAEQALGRIVDIQRHGSPEAARGAAKRYLARYPNGAYAALARSVLSP